MQFLFLSPLLESAILPSSRRRLHKIGIKKTDKEKEKREKRAAFGEERGEQKPCLTRALCVTSCIENPYLRVPVIFSSIVFHVSPRVFGENLAPAKKKGKEEARFFLSLSLCLAYFFASIARCISRVVECKLLRA